MNVFITFDYELFFGEKSGTVEKCIIEPTNELIAISKKHNVNFTYFVDAGYLVALEKLKKNIPQLENDYNKVCKQLIELKRNGDSIQLHIHPHWEKAEFKDGTWMFNLDGCYSLAQFSDFDAKEIFKKYKNTLESIISDKVTSYRAGGLAFQPFSKIKDCFLENEIFIDSSVLNFGYKKTPHYAFDYLKAPDKGRYTFNTSESIEEKGPFLEIPIGSFKYNFIFYWSLYVRGYLFPKRHKFIGDGNYSSTPNEKKQKLLIIKREDNCSVDGYYSRKIISAIKFHLRKKRTDLVFLGHPKSQTKYSLVQIDHSVKKMLQKVTFKTFDNI
jgi:hypothetical protein